MVKFPKINEGDTMLRKLGKLSRYVDKVEGDSSVYLEALSCVFSGRSIGVVGDLSGCYDYIGLVDGYIEGSGCTVDNYCVSIGGITFIVLERPLNIRLNTSVISAPDGSCRMGILTKEYVMALYKAGVVYPDTLDAKVDISEVVDILLGIYGDEYASGQLVDGFTFSGCSRVTVECSFGSRHSSDIGYIADCWNEAYVYLPKTVPFKLAISGSSMLSGRYYGGRSLVSISVENAFYLLHEYGHHLDKSLGNKSEGLEFGDIYRSYVSGLGSMGHDSLGGYPYYAYYSKPSEVFARAFEYWYMVNYGNSSFAGLCKNGIFSKGEYSPFASMIPVLNSFFFGLV